MKKVTLEQKKEAVRIAIKGGDPVNYLRVCGSRDPGQMWAMIRAKLRKDNPEIFLKLPKPEVKQKEEVPEQVPTVKVDGPLQIETKEPEQVEVVPVPTVQLVYDPSIAEEYKREQAEKHKIAKPLNYDGFDVLAVKREFGRYSRQDTTHGTYIDYTSHGGDELSMTVEQWREFLVEIKHAAQVLGVDI